MKLLLLDIEDIESLHSLEDVRSYFDDLEIIVGKYVRLLLQWSKNRIRKVIQEIPCTASNTGGIYKIHLCLIQIRVVVLRAGDVI